MLTKRTDKEIFDSVLLSISILESISDVEDLNVFSGHRKEELIKKKRHHLTRLRNDLYEMSLRDEDRNSAVEIRPAPNEVLKGDTEMDTKDEVYNVCVRPIPYVKGDGEWADTLGSIDHLKLPFVPIMGMSIKTASDKTYFIRNVVWDCEVSEFKLYVDVQ